MSAAEGRAQLCCFRNGLIDASATLQLAYVTSAMRYGRTCLLIDRENLGCDEDLMDFDATDAYEHTELAQHAAHSGSSFLSKVAVSIALLAVLAAGAGSLETIESGAATAARTESVLLQNKATDNWNFFQAKSLKKNMYEIAAGQGGPSSMEWQAQAKRNDTESQDVQKVAREFEAKSELSSAEAERHETRHHLLTVAATFLHIAIAIATIAIITGGQRWPWYASLGLGTIGTVLVGVTYLT